MEAEKPALEAENDVETQGNRAFNLDGSGSTESILVPGRLAIGQKPEGRGKPHASSHRLPFPPFCDKISPP
jgi:hypothetical protein